MLRTLLVVLLLAHAAPVEAQRSLAGRMRAFRQTAQEQPIDSVLEFFPRRGEWTWVQTVHYPGRPDHVRVRRFSAGETRGVIDGGGIACESFMRVAAIGIPGVLMDHLTDESWRRVDGTRFVPPGARSPAFVQWRREDERWVIDAYGDEVYEAPRLLGVVASTVRRDPVQRPLELPLPADGHYAEAEPWYPTHESLVFEGRHFQMYGPPVVFAAGEISRIASWGRVGVYAETGATGILGALYVPINARGEFQRYWVEHAGPPPACR